MRYFISTLYTRRIYALLVVLITSVLSTLMLARCIPINTPPTQQGSFHPQVAPSRRVAQTPAPTRPEWAVDARVIGEGVLRSAVAGVSGIHVLVAGDSGGRFFDGAEWHDAEFVSPNISVVEYCAQSGLFLAGTSDGEILRGVPGQWQHERSLVGTGYSVTSVSCDEESRLEVTATAIPSNGFGYPTMARTLRWDTNGWTTLYAEDSHNAFIIDYRVVLPFGSQRLGVIGNRNGSGFFDQYSNWRVIAQRQLPQPLLSAWARSATDIWAIAEQHIWHYDGRTWANAETMSQDIGLGLDDKLTYIFGYESDAFILGRSGIILYLDTSRSPQHAGGSNDIRELRGLRVSREHCAVQEDLWGGAITPSGKAVVVGDHMTVLWRNLLVRPRTDRPASSRVPAAAITINTPHEAIDGGTLATPVSVADGSQVQPHPETAPSRAYYIAAGDSRVCALLSDRTVRCEESPGGPVQTLPGSEGSLGLVARGGTVCTTDSVGSHHRCWGELNRWLGQNSGMNVGSGPHMLSEASGELVAPADGVNGFGATPLVLRLPGREVWAITVADAGTAPRSLEFPGPAMQADQGKDTICARLRDQSVHCLLSVGREGGRAVPVADVARAIDIRVGPEHACAILADRQGCSSI